MAAGPGWGQDRRQAGGLAIWRSAPPWPGGRDAQPGTYGEGQASHEDLCTRECAQRLRGTRPASQPFPQFFQHGGSRERPLQGSENQHRGPPRTHARPRHTGPGTQGQGDRVSGGPGSEDNQRSHSHPHRALATLPGPGKGAPRPGVIFPLHPRVQRSPRSPSRPHHTPLPRPCGPVLPLCWLTHAGGGVGSCMCVCVSYSVTPPSQRRSTRLSLQASLAYL